ncbi:GAF domain-containing protein [Halorussus halobius]|uniref:GAF domain-containing protein n=1 Tax=Halorussus halobius TaxID=1710537 RepID=UPI00143DE0B0|nr:GAF domain-containing protein [Halorussus halobius]
MPNDTVLYVDGEESSSATALERLRGQARDGTFVAATSLADAKEVLQDRPVDCVVTAYDLPDGTGLDLAEHVRTVAPDAGCVLYTGTDRAAIDTDGAADVVTEFVPKGGPGAVEELCRVVEFTLGSRTQSAYPLPQNEADRLDALDAYELDSESLRSDVKRITDLAARYFDAPKASVNLIKEHSQEFLACHGADWTPTAREDSICTYTILDAGEITVIGDVKADPRFADNESLDELGIRSYAGATLVTDGGLCIGTLCVYDEEPRTFSTDDREYLDTLAELAMSVIELRHRLSSRPSGPDDHGTGGDGS